MASRSPVVSTSSAIVTPTSLKPSVPSSVAERSRRHSMVSDVPDKPVETEENVHVICRIRPFNSREIELHKQSIEGKPEWEQYPLRSVIEFQGNQCIFLDHEKEWVEKDRFVFDSCLWSIPSEIQSSVNPFAGQEALFKEFGEKMLAQAWKGYNTCFFAYGQTGSGKTYSMMGSDLEDPGLTPRVCQKVFEQVEERLIDAAAHRDSYGMSYKVEVKYLEIYNEMVKDLLWSLSPLPADVKLKINSENMKVRSSPATGVSVEHLTSVEVDGWRRMLELIELGNGSRHTASTKMNERSSRSHAIFKISISQVTTTIPKKQFEKPIESARDSTINLVDLAGSERNKKTGATGDRLKEAASINKSLHCLKQVIDALVDNCTTKGPKKRIPYRDSHLTSLLMDSLGGNSKTFMLVTLSPHCDNAEETLQTLKYGSRARQIVNVVHVNENAASRMMFDLEDQLERMKRELESASRPEDVEKLRAEILEHETTIASLNVKMEEQQSRIEQLRTLKDKDMKQRHAVVVQHLHQMTQSRERRQEAEDEQRRNKRILAGLRRDKAVLDRRVETAEKDQDALHDLVEEHKRQMMETEHEIDQWRKKLRRLDLYRGELVRAVEEQDAEVKRAIADRIATVLRGRLQSARLRIEHARRQREQQIVHESELRRVTQATTNEEETLVTEFNEKFAAGERESAQLAAQLAALEADLAKLETEKGGQITKLQEEVTQLQADFQKKSAEKTVRIRQTQTDWERRYATMVADMERQHHELAEQWETRHSESIQAEDEQFNKSSAQWKEQLARATAEWDEKRRTVTTEGQARCRSAETAWEAKLGTKVAANNGLKARLQLVADSEEKYAALYRRISTLLDLKPDAVHTSASPARNLPPQHTHNHAPRNPVIREVYDLLKAYHSEYTDNQPSNYRLQQLLRGEYMRSRCAAPPCLSDLQNGSSGDAANGAAGTGLASPAGNGTVNGGSTISAANFAGTLAGTAVFGVTLSATRAMMPPASAQPAAGSRRGGSTSPSRSLRSIKPLTPRRV